MISGDQVLSPVARRLFFLLNRLNNTFPLCGKSGMEVRRFCCDYERFWGEMRAKESPARALSKLFWMDLPWARIREELGEIHCFDTGCGKGKYGPLLLKFSDNRIAKYVGVDIEPRAQWESIRAAYTKISLMQSDAAGIRDCIPAETNFFVTQSAIEHFKKDLLYFKQIRDFIVNKKTSIVQVHLLPAPACLKLYGLHGVRQYPLHAIGRIVNIFRKYSYAVLYELGGTRSRTLHDEYITGPITDGLGDLRHDETGQYACHLREAIRDDMSDPYGEPLFYALIIHSFGRQKIF